MERYGQGSPYLRIKGILSTPEWKAAWNILSRPDLESHIHIPGVGYINGLQSGNFVENTGNTACAVDTEVGLVLDAAGSVGAELIVNGDFSNGSTGWYNNAGTGSVSNGEMVVSGTSAGHDVDQILTLASDKTYVVTGKVTAGTAGGYLNVMRGSGGGYAGLGSSSTVSSGSQVVSLVFKATGSDVIVTLRVAGAGNAKFDNISVREITGTHASQATTANKPILRRGIVNLLTYSNDLTNAAWLTVLATKDSASSFSLTNQTSSTVYQYKSGLTAGVTYTAAALLSGPVGTQIKLRLEENGGAYNGGEILITLTSTPTLYTVPFTVGAVTQLGFLLRGVGTACTVTLGGAGIFQGTLNAQQIIAAGGIPLTTTAPASSQYGIGEPVLGPELVTNGGFDNGATGWALTGASIASGVCTFSASNQFAEQANVFTSGKTYLLTFDKKDSNAGSLWLYNGQGLQVIASLATPSVGIQSFTFTANRTDKLLINGNGYVGSIDNISVREITGYKSLPNSYAWQFDGVNDNIATGTPAFQITDDHCLVVAARCDSDASNWPFVASPCFKSSGAGEGLGLFVDPSSVISARWKNDAGVSVYASSGFGKYSRSIPFVGTARRVGANADVRFNGVSGGWVGAPVGLATVNNCVIGHGDNPFNGQIFGVIAIKGTVSDAELRVLEVAVASTAGVTIP